MASNESGAGSSQPETQQPPSTANNGYDASDSGFAQWRNIFSILTGRMTDAGKDQYR